MTSDTAPLAGVTVLEFGQVIAGNYAGALLADLGATVIKIESVTGDPARNPQIAAIDGESAIHLTVNRGKRSVVVDMKSGEGRDLFYRLVREADVVLDNFRPGVLERLKVDADTLRGHNPSIVCASVTGFGQYGPAMQRPAFDLVIQGISGHMAITGEPDRPPTRAGVPLADLVGGIFGCLTVLAALLDRQRSGRGRVVDVSMLDCLVSLLTYDATIFLNTGKQLERMGSAQAHMVPWQAFATKDGYVTVAAREEKFWQRLCDALERPDLLDDPRSRTNHDRMANREWVVARLSEAFATRTTAEWTEIFERADLPAGPVHDFAGVFSDPQVQARDLVQSYDHPDLGEIRYVTSPAKISGWTYPRVPAPRLGEHTEEVLRERLGLTVEQVRALAARGVVRTGREPDAAARAAD